MTSASSAAEHRRRAVLFDQHDHLRLRAADHELRPPSTAVPSAPIVSPEASPGSQRSRCSGVPAVLDHRRRQRTRQERHRSERAAELLAQDRQLDRAEALAAVLLRDRDPRPAQLAQLAPQLVVRARPPPRARAPARAWPARPAARAPCAGSRAGRPSGRSPWIRPRPSAAGDRARARPRCSSAPPWCRPRSCSRARAAAHSSSSRPPSAPPARRCRPPAAVSRWLVSDHSHFTSEPSGPGWP